MTESGATRVAVYLDFDNIVISRYDQVTGRNASAEKVREQITAVLSAWGMDSEIVRVTAEVMVETDLAGVEDALNSLHEGHVLRTVAVNR